MSKHCVILSVSSDIGIALARDWLKRGFSVSGTYRTMSSDLKLLIDSGVELVELDLADDEALNRATEALGSREWDRLILGAGTQEPVGAFTHVDPAAWVASVNFNFARPFEFLAKMLPARRTTRGDGSRVLGFAGPAVNGANVNYSAYTVSKIASIKMMELLAAEVSDTAFTMLGPGWVNTKIHRATLEAGSAAGHNLALTQQKLDSDDFFPMWKVVDAVNWILEAPHAAVSGRNFSAVHDDLGNPDLITALIRDVDLYKLRRAGNGRKF